MLSWQILQHRLNKDTDKSDPEADKSRPEIIQINEPIVHHKDADVPQNCDDSKKEHDHHCQDILSEQIEVAQLM